MIGGGDLLGETVLAGPVPKGLGAAMQGGGDKVHRQPSDYYPTPGDVTRAFLRVEGARIQRVCTGVFPYQRERDFWEVWEPCGRGGAIMREFAAFGLPMVGTDLVADPDNGVEPLDVLAATCALSPVVVTNPPFAIAADIIAHLLERLKVRYLALLLKATFWHAAERGALFERHRPARIYALQWRPDFLNKGAPAMDVIWCVWDRDEAGWATEYHLLPRLESAAVGDLLEGSA